MTKPAITKRAVKAAALTYAELDTNFQNLKDATITVAADTGSIVNDLNGSMTVAGGTALTTSVSGTTLTVDLDNTGVTAGSYTNANITVDAQGRITLAANGTGGALTNVVDDTSPTLGGDLEVNGLAIIDSTSTAMDFRSNNGFNFAALSPNTLNKSISFNINGSTDMLIESSSSYNLRLVAGTDGSAKITTPSIIRSDVAAGTAMLDRTSNASYINGATVDFANFSGMIIVNRQDVGSGNVALWIVGSGGAVKLGDSIGNQSGTIASNSGINGYRWTNTTGGTITASFAAIRTRAAG